MATTGWELNPGLPGVSRHLSRCLESSSRAMTTTSLYSAPLYCTSRQLELRSGARDNEVWHGPINQQAEDAPHVPLMIPSSKYYKSYWCYSAFSSLGPSFSSYLKKYQGQVSRTSQIFFKICPFLCIPSLRPSQTSGLLHCTELPATLLTRVSSCCLSFLQQ